MSDPLDLSSSNIPKIDTIERDRDQSKKAEEYFNRGNDFVKAGDFDSAIAEYSEAIRLTPKAAIYYNRGNSYRARGNYDQAIEDYTEAIRLKPQTAEFYNNRGNLYNDIKQDIDAALSDYSEAIHLKPQHANAYYGRGNTHSANGDKEQVSRIIPRPFASIPSTPMPTTIAASDTPS